MQYAASVILPDNYEKRFEETSAFLATVVLLDNFRSESKFSHWTEITFYGAIEFGNNDYLKNIYNRKKMNLVSCIPELPSPN